ncbi:MAG: heat-inducible transcriptional repressor HrcA [Halothiobacillaceae bacterium]
MTEWSDLSERAQTLLRALIDRYIEAGTPVGSRTLSRMGELNISPATIRNVMADLEELGLIRAPHTSAGRVPTEQGYRLFVNSLLVQRGGRAIDADKLERALLEETQGDPQRVAGTASNLLSSLTRFAGVVTVPRPVRAAFRQIEFIGLSEHRVLTVLVTRDGQVQNRIVTTDRPYGRAELVRFSNYLNETLAGVSVQDMRSRLLEELRNMRADIEAGLREAIALAESAVAGDDESAEADVIVAGHVNLMGLDELSSMERVKRLFQAFSEKKELLELLDRCERADGVQIFIGSESGSPTFEECSVIGAPYAHEGEILGVLGVIGPKRMHYDQVIQIVDLTSRLMGKALGGR